MPLRILVADDHSIIRSGLCALINAEPDLEVVGEANSGEEALELASRLTPDLVLMDLSMPGIGGIEATRQLVKQQAGIRIIILTMHDEKAIIQDALQAGAAGYIIKKAVVSDLIQAIKVVMHDDLYVHPTIVRTLFSETIPVPEKQPMPAANTLTFREMDVLRLIARGYTNTQIAEELTISIRTVEFHRGNLMNKLNAQSRMDLVDFAAKHGFLNREN